MKLSVPAKVILQVPDPKPNETAADIVLGIEQALNANVGILFTPRTRNKVGVRFHFEDPVAIIVP